MAQAKGDWRYVYRWYDVLLGSLLLIILGFEFYYFGFQVVASKQSGFEFTMQVVFFICLKFLLVSIWYLLLRRQYVWLRYALFLCLAFSGVVGMFLDGFV